MIKIRVRSLPEEGEGVLTEIITIGIILGPLQTLRSFCRRGWYWTLDYSRVTLEEKIIWGGADITVRAVRALSEGRVLRIGREEFDLTDTEAKKACLSYLYSLNRLLILEEDNEARLGLGLGDYLH